MVYVGEIPLGDLPQEIREARSIDSLLLMRQTFYEREDMSAGERQYYESYVEQRINDILTEARVVAHHERVNGG